MAAPVSAEHMDVGGSWEVCRRSGIVSVVEDSKR